MRTMETFAGVSLARLLGRVGQEIARADAAAGFDADMVHDIRVAIRRANQALRVFVGLVPRGPAKKLRRRLKRVLDAASSVRDCDIALQLFGEVRLPPAHPAWEETRARRVLAENRLRRIVREITVESQSGVWLGELGLGVG